MENFPKVFRLLNLGIIIATGCRRLCVGRPSLGGKRLRSACAVVCALLGAVPGARAITYVSGTISTNTTWTVANSVYVVTSDVTVNAGATLTIQPGVIVKFTGGQSYRSLFVNGALNAQGTSGTPIIFTSDRDDVHGGDSNGDGVATTPAAGDWGYVKLSGPGSTIQYCQFWYGGLRYDNPYHNYILWVSGVYPGLDVRNCTFRYAYDAALRYDYSGPSFATAPTIATNDIGYCGHGIVLAGNELFQPTVSSNTFTATTYGLEEQGAVAPQYSGNNLGTRPWIAVSGTIAGNVRWENVPGLVYVVDGDVTVNAGATLTIDLGVIVKFTGGQSYRSLFVNGALNAQGTSGSPIIFTSDRDDVHGGDSNGDGVATTPAAGDWGYVKVSGAGSTIQYCQFWYGGLRYDNPYHNYMLWVEAGDASVARCDFRNAYSVGLYLSPPSVAASNPLVIACSFSTCPTGIQYQGSSSLNSYGRIYGNVFTNGSVGILVSQVGFSLAVHQNQFNGMATYGVQSTDTTRTVDAQNNWWGQSSGPGGAGPGTGSPVSQYVTYTSWWTSPTQNTQGVWNVIAQRRGDSMLVDIYYDLIGDAGSTYRVSMAVSTTGGEPYTISPLALALSGAVGSGISPGTGQHILWDAAAGGGGGYTAQMRVKVTADLQ